MNRIIEMVLGEGLDSGIFAVSVVENPAIEEDFVYLSKQQESVMLSTIDEERHILLGAALIPNLQILRLDENGEKYYIYFSEKTVRDAAERYFIQGNQSNATLEHEVALGGLTIVESWIIEDDNNDKSRAYGMNHPVGTWMIAMKVHNEEIWQEYVKTGKVKGFSIEGKFSQAAELSAITQEDAAHAKIVEIMNSEASDEDKRDSIKSVLLDIGYTC